MQVRLLGPVDVVVDDESRAVHGVRRGAVLAALALHCGEVVSTGRLVDIVWGETAPPTVVNTLQAHVSYLRGVLGSKAAIRARPPGYVLDLGAGSTDVQMAERLLRQGTRAADPVQGARLLETALALWRGRALADLTGLPWHRPASPPSRSITGSSSHLTWTPAISSTPWSSTGTRPSSFPSPSRSGPRAAP